MTRHAAISLLDRAPSTASLLSRVAALEQTVADLSRRVAAPVSARVDDASFVATIAGAVQGRVFSARELHQHAAAVDPALARVLGSMSIRRLGKQLHALSRRDAGPLRIVRVGRDADGIVWTCVSA